MQVSKSFSGTVTLEEKTKPRLVSYGVETTANVYPSQVDRVNTIIADFLHGTCGVDASYTSKGSVSDKFLWIYGVPFLFNIVSGNSIFYGPCYGYTIQYTGTSGSPAAYRLFNNASGKTGEYSFGLIFSGNPNNGFALRFKLFNNTNVNNGYVMRFMRCTNLINGSDSVVFSGRPYYSVVSGSSYTLATSGMNGIDLSGPKGMINPDSFSQYEMTYSPLLYTKNIQKVHNEGALPLVPLCVGPYRANGIFLRPVQFDLPPAFNNANEILPEITISGRSFLITNSDTFSTGYINMGLIETT